MVVPPRGLITVGIADLRADPDDHSELVDQAHLNEQVTVLGARSDWRYVQGADQYFGWVRTDQLFEIPGSNSDGIVAVLLADVHELESRNSPVIERLPPARARPRTGGRHGRANPPHNRNGSRSRCGARSRPPARGRAFSRCRT